ncbi:hypothetical protein E4U27_004211 [Claviceps purpurea]|nr:hypothetical protein E4U27_004211 [Claviceps purpurea]
MGKDRRALPILDRENHQDGLRRVRITINSKGVAIAIEFTKHEEGGAANATPTAPTAAASTANASTNATSNDTAMDDLPMHLHLLSQIEQIEVSSSRFERLRGSWNIEKAKEWTHANAKCLSIMLDGLTSDDAVIIDEYETAAAVWAQLQKRYGVAAYPPSGGDILVLCRKKYPISSRKEEYQTASISPAHPSMPKTGTQWC